MTAILVSVEEAMQMLGIGRTQIYKIIRQGEIKTAQIGRRRLINVASLHEFANSMAA